MINWQLFEFFGIVPRLKGNLLPRNHATIAYNVDLTHGTLKPFREPLKISNKVGGARLYAFDCNLFVWDKCVSVAEWLPDCPRLFITGRANYPETATIEEGKLVYRRMGVPRPTSAPTIIGGGEPSETSRETAYVVTFVNRFGEEGAPSLPSRDVILEDGQLVKLLFSYNPPLEYDVTHLRIYRRETGFRTGGEKTQELATEWFNIAELPISQTKYNDTVKMIELNYGLVTKDVRPPPEDFKNITLVPSTALLVGSSKNKLLFSKHLQPHNFPLSDEMTLDDNIVALGALGNTLFVATDGYPYKLIADMGCDNRDCRDIVRYEEPHPMIACHTGKGSVITPFGFVYVTADGLVLLPEQGPPKVITTDVLSADDWRLLEPQSMRLAWHKGALFIVSEKVTFMYWFDTSTYGDTKNKRLVTLSDTPVDMVQTRQGELLLMTGDGIYQWNASNKIRPYKWASEFIDSGHYFAITRVRAKVQGAGVKISTISDRGVVERIFPVGSTIIPFRRHGRRKEFNIVIEGIGEVLEIGIGVSKIDMSARGA